MKSSKRGYIPIFLAITGIIALLIPLVNSASAYIRGGRVNLYISFIPNCIILFNSYIMRLYLCPTHAEDLAARLCDNFRCFSRRAFIHYIFLAMNVGFLATVTIYIHFLLGVFFYLIMHILLIVGYAKVINLNIFEVAKEPFLLRGYIFSIFFWMLVTPLLFFGLVWRGAESLPILPYVVMLGFMAAVSFAGLFNLHTPLLFRLMIFSGSLVFVISDLFIGITGPEQQSVFRYWINPTYITAIFFISHSIIPLSCSTSICQE